MSATEVYRPPTEHHCGPNDYGIWLGHEWEPAGTVLVCDCGQGWVSQGEPSLNPKARFHSLISTWRKERWRERRRRLRAA